MLLVKFRNEILETDGGYSCEYVEVPKLSIRNVVNKKDIPKTGLFNVDATAKKVVRHNRIYLDYLPPGVEVQLDLDGATVTIDIDHKPEPEPLVEESYYEEQNKRFLFQTVAAITGPTQSAVDIVDELLANGFLAWSVSKNLVCRLNSDSHRISNNMPYQKALELIRAGVFKVQDFLTAVEDM